MLSAQYVVKKLVLDCKLNINFLRAVINGNTLTLHGVAESAVLAEKAVQVAAELMKDKEIMSCISVVQDFKSYP